MTNETQSVEQAIMYNGRADEVPAKPEACRCPVRPYYSPGSMASGSTHEDALLRRWNTEHRGHSYAKARDELAHALQHAERSVKLEEGLEADEAVLDMVFDIFSMRRRSDGPDPDVAYDGKVYKSGGYHASMHPDAKPYMINAIDGILRDCAAHNTPEEAARFNALRLEMFRIFPEQKEGYISDPVEAIQVSQRPPQPSPEHIWDGLIRKWRLPNLKGQAISPNTVGA